MHAEIGGRDEKMNAANLPFTNKRINDIIKINHCEKTLISHHTLRLRVDNADLFILSAL